MSFGRYITKRVIHSFVVIYAVATSIFLVVRMIPGDPARVMLGEAESAEAYEAMRAELGLDQPLYVQYGRWIIEISQGDFGRSVHSGELVTDLILQAAEPTVSIAVVGGIVAITIGIPGGIISAVKQYHWEDIAATLLSFTSISMPAFWVAILLVLAFTDVRFFKTFGYTSYNDGIVPWLQSIILPGIAAGVPYGGILMRMTRSSMLEVLNKDYIRTARAKGLTNDLVIFKHGFQNAMIPVTTLLGITLAVLLVGTLAVEIVFGVYGFGRLLIGSVHTRDYPIIQGAVIVISFVFVFMNLLVDIMYTVINPKIRYTDR